jgi:hypothetical protein
MFDIVGHEGLSYLDENIFNTYQSEWGTPLVLVGRKMQYRATDVPVDDGPGAFVAPDILERGYNAWYEAPGYYVDVPGTDRVIADQYVHLGVYSPKIMQGVGSGGNPWDWIFGTVGSYGLNDGTGVRDWPDQSGEYSLS